MGSDLDKVPVTVRSVTSADELRESGVLWRSYLSAGRHLVPLVLPGVLVYVPVSVLIQLMLVVSLDDSAAVINDRLHFIGGSDGSLLIWAGLLVTAGILGQALVFPATVVLAAGRFVDRPVSPVAALRAAARRLPSTLLLVVVGVLAYAAVGAAGFGVLLLTRQEWMAIAVMVTLALTATPGLLAVPGVMLHGCTALGAIRHAYRLSRLRRRATAFTLAFGVVVVPAAATWGLGRGLGLLPGALETVGSGVAGFALALAITPVQAAVVTRQFLHCLAWRTEDSNEAEDLVRGLPGSAPGPFRRVLLLTVLLPAVLFSGVVLVNPFGWPEVSQTNVTESWQKAEPSGSSGSSDDGPELRPFDLRDVHAGRGGSLAMVIDGYDDYASLLTCADTSCEKTSFTWAEQRVAGTDPLPGAVSVRLPDGRLLLTTWSGEALRMLTCEADECVPVPGGGTVAKADRPAYYAGVAMAVRQGGLVVAFADKERVKGDADPTKDIVSFVFCADVACAHPAQKRVARLDATSYLPGVPSLAVTTAPGGRPVAARFDIHNGQIHVISCADAACLRTRVTRPVPPYPPSVESERGRDTGLALVVRPDGRPLIAYRDRNDRATKLLDCRTPDCAQAEVITLDAGGPYRSTPVMVLDRAGRPLVAYQNHDGTRLMLATCTGPRCVRTAVARIGWGPGDGLVMTLNDQGRPTIAWMDDNDALFGGEWRLIVTTPLNLAAD
jgi:hypothetical protein